MAARASLMAWSSDAWPGIVIGGALLGDHDNIPSVPLARRCINVEGIVAIPDDLCGHRVGPRALVKSSFSHAKYNEMGYRNKGPTSVENPRKCNLHQNQMADANASLGKPVLPSISFGVGLTRHKDPLSGRPSLRLALRVRIKPTGNAPEGQPLHDHREDDDTITGRHQRIPPGTKG